MTYLLIREFIKKYNILCIASIGNNMIAIRVSIVLSKEKRIIIENLYNSIVIELIL